MALWTGCTCSYCGEEFKDTDDVVVCPDCGAPYHRECYAKSGKCVFSEKHGTDFEYKRPTKTIKMKCANCGTENEDGTKYCVKCGVALNAESTLGNEGGASQPTSRPLYMPIDSVVTHPTENPIEIPREMDGINSMDWANYIGSSAPYYLLQFKQMELTKRKTSFCWSALIFPPMYFLYRKMWAEGIGAAIITVLLSIPSFLYTFKSVGITLPFTISLAALDTLSLVCNIISWAFQIVCGLFAFYLYKKSAAKKISAINAKSDASTHDKNLVLSGGTSKIAVAILFVSLMALSMGLAAWVGPSKLAALYYF